MSSVRNKFQNTRQTGTGTGTQQFENNNSLQDIRKNGNCVKYFEKVIIYKVQRIIDTAFIKSKPCFLN